MSNQNEARRWTHLLAAIASDPVLGQKWFTSAALAGAVARLGIDEANLPTEFLDEVDISVHGRSVRVGRAMRSRDGKAHVLAGHSFSIVCRRVDGGTTRYRVLVRDLTGEFDAAGSLETRSLEGKGGAQL